MKRTMLTLTLSLSLTPALVQAVPQGSSDPRAIMQAVHKRDTGDRLQAQVRLTIQDKFGGKRVRRMRTSTMEFAEGTKTLTIFQDPPDIRNTGFLSVDYDAGVKEDDQWLYLPGLHKTSRITTDNRSGSFMGSDFSYADLSKADPADYDLKLLKPSVKIDGEDCWVIGAKPRTKKAKDETGYIDLVYWVSKQKVIPLQIKARVKAGKKIKYMKFNDIKKHGNVWVIYKQSARMVQKGKVLSQSLIEYTSAKLNSPEVKASEFTPQRLEKGL